MFKNLSGGYFNLRSLGCQLGKVAAKLAPASILTLLALAIWRASSKGEIYLATAARFFLRKID